MSRIRIAVVLGLLLGAGLVLAQEKDKAKEPPRDKGPRGEKIDARVNRSLAGVVEKVEAKSENSGTLQMRSSGPAKESLYRYTFLVSSKTKIVTARGKPLKDGLKSRRLAKGAEVVVQFDDRKPGSDRPAPAGKHFAHRIQLIEPTKK